MHSTSHAKQCSSCQYLSFQKFDQHLHDVDFHVFASGLCNISAFCIKKLDYDPVVVSFLDLDAWMQEPYGSFLIFLECAFTGVASTPYQGAESDIAPII